MYFTSIYIILPYPINDGRIPIGIDARSSSILACVHLALYVKLYDEPTLLPLFVSILPFTGVLFEGSALELDMSRLVYGGRLNADSVQDQ